MTTPEEIEGFVAEFGEEHRRMITLALEFLNEHEPSWGLDKPMNRRQYIRECVSRVAPVRAEFRRMDDYIGLSRTWDGDR